MRQTRSPDPPLKTGRIRFILIGAVVGIAWAASLRGFMSELAGPASAFAFSGTFGIIIPVGVVVGALLGWAEYQRRTGLQYRLLIAPKPYPDLSATTPHGAWFATLASSLFVTLALASSIPMRRPASAGRPEAANFPRAEGPLPPVPAAPRWSPSGPPNLPGLQPAAGTARVPRSGRYPIRR